MVTSEVSELMDNLRDRLQISRTSYFRAVKQFIYSRTNNFRALTKLIFLRGSKLWLKIFSKTLREIFRNMGFLWSVFSRMWAESHLYFPVFGQNRRCMLTNKTGVLSNSSVINLVSRIKIKKQSGTIIKVCVTLEINFWHKHKFPGCVMWLYWFYNEKDFQKSSLLFKLMKTFRSSNSVELPFSEFFHTRSPYQCLAKCAEIFLFCFVSSYKKNWRT